MPIFTSSLRPVDGIASGAYGGILQAKLGRNGGHFSTSSTSFVDVTDMNVTLTPQSSSSTFLILVSFGRASTRQSNLDHASEFRVMRQIGSGSFTEAHSVNGRSEGSRSRGCMTVGGLAYNDDHSIGSFAVVGCDGTNTTSAVTYKIQVRVQVSSHPLTLNRSYNNNDGSQVYQSSCQSSLIVLEMSG